MMRMSSSRHLLVATTNAAFRRATTSSTTSGGSSSSISSLILSRSFHPSVASRLAEVVMNVPSMGDSITEGTIKSWSKNVGDAIKIDDVVVVIETDKVSVDIRAKDAGVLVEQYADVDANVEVGAKLLKIDTEGTPSSSSSSAPSPTAAASSPPPPSPAAPSPAAAALTPTPTHTDDHTHGGRKPLIKFLGKRSLLGKGGSPALASPTHTQTPAVRYEDIKGTPGAKTFGEMPAMYGRPALSQKEIDAIESGGASL